VIDKWASAILATSQPQVGNGMARISGALTGDHDVIPALPPSLTEFAVPTDGNNNSELKKLNEVLLFHGTNEEKVERIIEAGLQPQRAGPHGKLFGVGSELKVKI
jgi:hypothetical protein